MRVPLVVLIDGISPGAGDIVLKIFLLLFSFQHTHRIGKTINAHVGIYL